MKGLVAVHGMCSVHARTIAIQGFCRATHAAELFPSATVVALDINPLPERFYPSVIMELTP